MNISIFKDMFDTHVHKLMELEKDYKNEDVQKEMAVRRDAFWYMANSYGICRCGYDGSTFVICYKDGRIKTI